MVRHPSHHRIAASLDDPSVHWLITIILESPLFLFKFESRPGTRALELLVAAPASPPNRSPDADYEFGPSAQCAWREPVDRNYRACCAINNCPKFRFICNPSSYSAYKSFWPSTKVPVEGLSARPAPVIE